VARGGPDPLDPLASCTPANAYKSHSLFIYLLSIRSYAPTVYLDIPGIRHVTDA